MCAIRGGGAPSGCKSGIVLPIGWAACLHVSFAAALAGREGGEGGRELQSLSKRHELFWECGERRADGMGKCAAAPSSEVEAKLSLPLARPGIAMLHAARRGRDGKECR